MTRWESGSNGQPKIRKWNWRKICDFRYNHFPVLSLQRKATSVNSSEEAVVDF